MNKRFSLALALVGLFTALTVAATVGAAITIPIAPAG